MNLKNRLFGLLSKSARSGLSISPQDAYKSFESGGAILVDVRERGEMLRGVCRGSKWVATSEIEAESTAAKDFILSLPREKDIVVYCAAGVRAGRFASILASQGFNAYNMGGYDDWVKANLPTDIPARTPDSSSRPI